jgi:hypothetical protein
MTETIDGITVLRGWLFASPKLSKFTKAAGFASFAASASLQSLLRRVRPDVVVSTSPPPTVGVPACCSRGGSACRWSSTCATSGPRRSPLRDACRAAR